MVYVLLVLFWAGIIAAIVLKSWIIAVATVLLAIAVPLMLLVCYSSNFDEQEPEKS